MGRVFKLRKSVYYYPLFGNYGVNSGQLNYWEKNTIELNPFVNDSIIEPVPQIQLHEKLEYTKCPAWQNLINNSYTVKSPVDLEIFFKEETKEIYATELTQYKFDSLIGVNKGSSNNWSGEKEVVFLIFIGYLFWTEDKDVWIEQSIYPPTLQNNNFEIIEGRFPLSCWTRSVVVGVRMKDFSKPISIKRGDFLYHVRFFSNFDKVRLIRKEPNQKLLNEYFRNVERKQWLPNSSWKLIKERFLKGERKCPM